MISSAIIPRSCSEIEYLLFQLKSEKSVTNRLTMQSDFKGSFGFFLLVKHIGCKNRLYGWIHRANHWAAHVRNEKTEQRFKSNGRIL